MNAIARWAGGTFLPFVQRNWWLPLIVGLGALYFHLWYRTIVHPVPYHIEEILVNYAGGFVRRGLSGEIAIALSRATGIPSDFVAVGLAMALATTLWALALRFYQTVPKSPVVLMCMLAPWGLLLLAYDNHLGVRKDLFGLIALLVLCLSIRPMPRAALATRLGLAIAITVFGIFWHELNAVSIPFQIAAMAMIAHATPSARPLLLTAGLILGGLGTAAFLVCLKHSLGDPEAICTAVRDTVSAPPNACWGPIQFLDDTLADNRQDVANRLNWLSTASIAVFAPATAFPLVLFRPVHRPLWHYLALLVLAALAVLPLFFVAIDWGRWLQAYGLMTSLLVLTAYRGGALRIAWTPPWWMVLPYIGSWSFAHVMARPGIDGFALSVGMVVIWLGVRIFGHGVRK